MNIFSLLERTAKRWPSSGAVYSGVSVIQTWAELHHRSLQLAASLAAYGPVGSRVVIATANTPEYLELLYGTWAAGQAVVPINFKLHPKEMLQIIEDAEPVRIFASASIEVGRNLCTPTRC